jgi:predicted nuclease of predicted toxin-antitoxin system
VLKGYADEHVVLALVEALRRRGMDIVRVQDRGREKADDADLLDEALAERRIMFTNDTDFLGLAAERAQQQRLFAPIIFWPQQRRSIGQIVRSTIREATRHDYESACSQVFFF